VPSVNWEVRGGFLFEGMQMTLKSTYLTTARTQMTLKSTHQTFETAPCPQSRTAYCK
jgi:hypothetical protein